MSDFETVATTDSPIEVARVIRVTAELGMAPAAKWFCPACQQTAMSMDGKLVQKLHSGVDCEIVCQCGCKQILYASRIMSGAVKPKAPAGPIIQGVR